MRYFFHIRDQELVIRDEEGTELPDRYAAHQEAQASARDLALDNLKSGRPIARLYIEIADEHGDVLDTLPVADVIH